MFKSSSAFFVWKNIQLYLNFPSFLNTAIHVDGSGSWNSLLWMKKTQFSWMANITAADGLLKKKISQDNSSYDIDLIFEIHHQKSWYLKEPW